MSGIIFFGAVEVPLIEKGRFEKGGVETPLHTMSDKLDNARKRYLSDTKYLLNVHIFFL